MARLWAWLATRAASAWIAAAALGLIGAFGIYVQQLRVKAARCETVQALQIQIDELTRTVQDQRGREFDEIREALKGVEDNCLDRPSPLDSLRDDPR